MPRKKSTAPSPYRMMTSAPVVSSPHSVEETGTIRLSLVLSVLDRMLQGHDELRQKIADEFAREGAEPQTRILA